MTVFPLDEVSQGGMLLSHSMDVTLSQYLIDSLSQNLRLSDV